MRTAFTLLLSLLVTLQVSIGAYAAPMPCSSDMNGDSFEVAEVTPGKSCCASADQTVQLNPVGQDGTNCHLSHGVMFEPYAVYTWSATSPRFMDAQTILKGRFISAVWRPPAIT